MSATIRRLYNDQYEDFDRSMLETAWLIRAEVDTAFKNSRNVKAAQQLRDELGWDFADAIVYVVVASNWDGKD